MKEHEERIRQTKRLVDEAHESLRDANRQIQELEQGGAPSWVLHVLYFLRDKVLARTAEETEKYYQSLLDGTSSYIEDLRKDARRDFIAAQLRRGDDSEDWAAQLADEWAAGAAPENREQMSSFFKGGLEAAQNPGKPGEGAMTVQG